MTSVLVIGEATSAETAGALAAITKELLGAAVRLRADLGGEVACALIGADQQAPAKAAIAAGAGTVYVADHVSLAQYQIETYLPIAAEIARRAAPNVILLGQTSMGRDLAPRLATRLDSAAAMDALDLAVAGDRVRVTRACYGGNARQVVSVLTDPQVITVRAKSQEPLSEDPGRTGAVEEIEVEVAKARATVTEKVTAEAEGVRLEDADIVVSGGRGLGAPEAFGDLERLAAILDAAVGASRAACDLGWYPPSQQVGLTGTVVSPNLYIAVAISGASQHMAGCSGSKNILAINKDPGANIFRFARFGLVDDYKKVLPALEEAFKKVMPKS